jgi:aspartate carbamoyltransferase catalytic subunit
VYHLLRISDLGVADVDEILARAELARTGSLGRIEGTIATLVFLSPSTRTRLGFQIATARLGGTAVGLSEIRETGPGLPSETLADTVRVCSGMSDVVVVRDDGLETFASLAEGACCSVVNGGDAWEHPTQALLDLFAIEQLAGPVGELHIGLTGDLTMRSTTSLLALLRVAPPRRLTLFAAPGRAPSGPLPPELSSRTDQPEESDFSEVEVLLLQGLPPGHGADRLDDAVRAKWGLSERTAARLAPGAVVLSPGPVIDEISPECRHDPRLRVFEQADLGLPLRMAVLSWLLDPN